MLREIDGERGTNRKQARNTTSVSDMFVQYLNRHGTDFSYIKSDPSFKEFSDEQLFNMYEEYITCKSILVNKIGRESKIAKIERIVRCSTKESLSVDEGNTAGQCTDECSYRAQALIEGRKQVQAVVDLRMDDFRLPFLLKDLELHLKQQLNYVGEIYDKLVKIGAISLGFIDDHVHAQYGLENSHNRPYVTHSKPEADASLCTQDVFQNTVGMSNSCNAASSSTKILDSGVMAGSCAALDKAKGDSVAVLRPTKGPPADHTLGSPDGLPTSSIYNEENEGGISGSPQTNARDGKAQSNTHSHHDSDKGTESMVDYPTSENVHTDSNAECYSDIVPDSTQLKHSKVAEHGCHSNRGIHDSENHSTGKNMSRSTEECLSSISMVLKADILNKYDDYLGDFSEDLLDMQLPIPSTSTYNPLGPQIKRIKVNRECEEEGSAAECSIGMTGSMGSSNKHPDDPARSSADNTDSVQQRNTGAARQNIQSMKKRNRSRVVVQHKVAPSAPELLDADAISIGNNHECVATKPEQCAMTQDGGVGGSSKVDDVTLTAGREKNLCDHKTGETQRSSNSQKSKTEQESIIALYPNKSCF